VGSPCSDEGSVGIAQGVDRLEVLLSVQHAMWKKAREMAAPMFAWKDFPQSYRPELSRIADSQGLFPLVSFPGTVADIADTKERYYASLKGSYRHQLKKKIKRSEGAVSVRKEVLQQPSAAIIDEIFALFWQNYERATTQFETLNREFFAQAAAYTGAYFITLREEASGDMLAFMLCFLSNGHVINKFIGIDHHRPKDYLLYFRLWDACIDWAIQQKAHIIQSGQTTYKPKIETGHRLTPLTHYCRHANPIIHCIYKLFARTVGWDTLDEDLKTYLAAHPQRLASA
jgi:hypothetical protein